MHLNVWAFARGPGGEFKMGTEICPCCGQEIEEHARKCFFCGSQLNERLEKLGTPDKRQVQVARKVISPKQVLVILIIILIGVVLFIDVPRAKRAPAATGLPERSMIHLDARVTYADRQLIILNSDPFDWNNVRLEINSATAGNGFELAFPTIAAGQTYAVSVLGFAKKDGTYFNPYAMKLRRLWIRCDKTNKESGSHLAVLE